MHWVCPDASQDVPELDGFQVWIDSDAPGDYGSKPYPVAAGGGLAGSSDKVEPGSVSHWEWSLTPVDS